MVSIDSFFASPMKPQVLTTMTSASRRVVDVGEARVARDAEHDLGVDPVLGAAEADEVDGLLSSAGTGRLRPRLRTSIRARRPSASVTAPRPVSVWPSHGVFRLFDRSRAGSTTNTASGSISAISAAAPSRIDGASIPTTRAGARVSASTSRASGSAPSRTSPSSTGTTSSSPIIPGEASENSQSFSSEEWGAWSVAIASIVPSASAARTRVDVRLLAERRVDLARRVVADAPPRP